jgi:hypothetical protein
MIHISKAIRSLHPDSEFAIEDEDINKIRWFLNQPSGYDFENGDDKESKLQELLTEVERLNQLDTANAYKTTRRIKYPTVTDQLDMLWHAIDTGTLDKSSDFYTTLKSVKNNYPKPE